MACFLFWSLWLLASALHLPPGMERRPRSDALHRVAVHLTDEGVALGHKRVAAETGHVSLGTVCDFSHHYIYEAHPTLRRRRKKRRDDGSDGGEQEDDDGGLPAVDDDEEEAAADAAAASRRALDALRAHPHVRWHALQKPRRFAKRSVQALSWVNFTAARASYVPGDPLFGNQWHLQDTSNVNVGAMGSWRQGATGQGVTVAIVDDGVQYVHPDLMENFNELASYDFNDWDNDVTPNPLLHQGDHDDHGTPAAGLCCASMNGRAHAGAKSQEAYCGVGVAYDATVAGLRILGRETEDYQNAAALCFMNQVIDIYSNRGPPDTGQYVEGPDTLAKMGMEASIEHGRQGLGVLYVWAGGNGRSRGDSCNFDGWANWRYTITVASVTERATQPYYSEECPALHFSAPSSGNGAAMTTTDLLGTWGKTSRDCLPTFGGTSAAAPTAAGAVAVVLSARPSLGWRDMQAVLIETASPAAVARAGRWLINGAGFAFSHQFGFGVVNTTAAVALARTWRNWPKEAVFNSSRIVVNVALGASKQAVDSTFKVARKSGGSGAPASLEHVEVHVNLRYPMRGLLEITLTSPAGTLSVFASRHNDRHADYPAGWRFTSNACWGESPYGEWRLSVTAANAASGGKTKGTFVDWSLVLYSHAQTDDEAARYKAMRARNKAIKFST